MDGKALLRAAVEASSRHQHAQALELCQQILRIPHRPLDLTANACRLKSRTLAVGLRRPGTEAVLAGQEAVRAARCTHDPALLAQCLRDAAIAAMYSGDYSVASGMARELLEVSPESAGQAAAHDILGWIEFLSDNFGLAGHHYHQAAAADPARAEARQGLALVEVRRGRPWRALQLARQALELTDPGDRRLRSRSMMLAAWAYLDMADFRSATQQLNQARVLAEAEGDGALMAYYYLLVALTAVRGHSPEQARFASDLAMAESLRAGRLDLYDLVGRELARVHDQEQWPDILRG